MENFTQYITLYMNKEHGNILTKSEMLNEWEELYDGGDETNPIPWTEYYTEYTEEIPVEITVDNTTHPRPRIIGKFRNIHGENVEIWITAAEHERNRNNSLMNLWVKSGAMEKFIPETISTETFVTDDKGNCYRKYDPQIGIPGYDRAINFRWILEYTDYNVERTINQCVRLANA